MIVRNRSWPAVSQIWSFIRFPSTSIVFTLKSILFHSTIQYNINQSVIRSFDMLLSATRKRDAPDRGDEGRRERVVRVAQQHATLADACSAYTQRCTENESSSATSKTGKTDKRIQTTTTGQRGTQRTHGHVAPLPLYICYFTRRNSPLSPMSRSLMSRSYLLLCTMVTAGCSFSFWFAKSKQMSFPRRTVSHVA